jgi:hypothetical protein
MIWMTADGGMSEVELGAAESFFVKGLVPSRVCTPVVRMF